MHYNHASKQPIMDDKPSRPDFYRHATHTSRFLIRTLAYVWERYCRWMDEDWEKAEKDKEKSVDKLVYPRHDLTTSLKKINVKADERCALSRACMAIHWVSALFPLSPEGHESLLYPVCDSSWVANIHTLQPCSSVSGVSMTVESSESDPDKRQPHASERLSKHPKWRAELRDSYVRKSKRIYSFFWDIFSFVLSISS